jgi:hypothetical protein
LKGASGIKGGRHGGGIRVAVAGQFTRTRI